jgi:protein farnesyltransferase subunit beta
LFDEGMLQRYILLCAQDVHGGLRDKPSAIAIFHHGCYNLSGLSVAQHYARE